MKWRRRLSPLMEHEGGGSGGNGEPTDSGKEPEKKSGKEDIPEWAQKLKKEMEDLKASISSGKASEDVQKIPPVTPPPNPKPEKSEEPEKPEPSKESGKSPSFLERLGNWLI